MNRYFLATITLLFALLASGCASTNAPRADPMEGLNRMTFKFNDVVDNAILTPVAKGYQAVTPSFVRAGVSNVFMNVGDVGTAANNLLQGKPGNAMTDVGRFLINSTFGILGIIDLATPMGLEKNEEDFGQTLGKWGVPSGPYLVLPLMGPSTLRDTTARAVDRYTGYTKYVDHIPTRNSANALEIVGFRAELLGTTNTLDEAALDKYQFTRDAFLQRRLNKVYDGKVPQEKRDKIEEDLEPPASPTAPPNPQSKRDPK